MPKINNIEQLSIKELVLGVQNSYNSNDRISFRSNEYFHELVRRCVKERGLSSEADFFTKLANDYFGKIGWMEREIRTPQFCSNEDLEITQEQYNIQRRKIEFYQNQSSLPSMP